MSRIARAMQAIMPGTLFLRLALAWCLALLATHLLNVGVSYLHANDYQITRTSYYLAKDLSLLVPGLEAAAPQARQDWLNKMARKAYSFELAPPGTPAPRPDPGSAERSRDIVGEIARELGARYPVTASAPTATDQALHLHMRLADGALLTAELRSIRLPMSWWGGVIFLAQVLAVVLLTWVAVRQATRPLLRLAEAAEALGTSMRCEPIAEDGPLEVARAAAAFNAMGRRIKEHLAERVRILAAISHDLQTPITRMRLRADLMEHPALRGKFQADLDAMQVLVEEGIAYARSADRVTEAACLVDIGALLDTLVCDYVDAGHSVQLGGQLACIVMTRPHTLRRIVMNLTDNALKFADQVDIAVTRVGPDRLAVCVRDRGPGIAPEHLAEVFQPFFRIENSRNRNTGGTGLGLAIAQQLSLALHGTLTLANRAGGGLEATLVFPISGLQNSPAASAEQFRLVPPAIHT
jgi:signal transduction histidine kinase